jgi:hypothetical protein
MAREKHVTPITNEEKQSIINSSVSALSNRPALSGEDMKKQFVSPIVNADGKPNIADMVNRIVTQTETALDELDETAGGAKTTAENVEKDLTEHKQAYKAHQTEYEAYKTAQSQKDEAQNLAISNLGRDKQDNLVIDGGYSERNPVATVKTVDNKLLPIEQTIPQLGATLAMSIDPLTYVLKVELKNKSGEVVSTVQSDLPLEEMVVDARLGDDNKTIILELKNGNSVSFSVADLVSGLVTTATFEEALANKTDKLNEPNMLQGTDAEGNPTAYPLKSVGTNVYVGGERVEEFNADDKLDADKVGAPNGVPSLDETGKIPKTQLPASATGLDIGETFDTAFAGDRGVKLERQVKTLYSFHEEEGDIIVTTIDTAFNERTTADGANVVDGSLAVLEKVEGNSIASKNYFDVSQIPVSPTQAKVSISKVTDNGFEMVRSTGGTTTGDNSKPTLKGLKDFCPKLRVGQTVYLYVDRNFTWNNYIFLTGGLITGNLMFEIGKAITVTEEMLSSNNVIWYIPATDGTYTFSNIRVVETQNEPYTPYFKGLKSASFKGIESKDKDGNVISTLEFTESIPTPLGTTIDFENKKITNYGVTLVLTGAENWKVDNTFELYGVEADNIVPTVENGATGICTDAELGCGKHLLRIGLNNKRNIKWVGILEKLGYAVSTVDERAESLGKFKAWLAERYSAGNPVTIRYISSELQSEVSFTGAQRLVGDNYIVAPQGTETVLGNDTEAENKPTIEYVIKAGA